MHNDIVVDYIVSVAFALLHHTPYDVEFVLQYPGTSTSASTSYEVYIPVVGRCWVRDGETSNLDLVYKYQ